MTRFIAITFTDHALERKRLRRVGRDEVETVLANGEGYLDEDGTWVYDLEIGRGRLIRVIVVEEGERARVITVIRLRKST